MGIRFEGGEEQMKRVMGVTDPIDYRSFNKPGGYRDSTCIDPAPIRNPNLIKALERVGIKPGEDGLYNHDQLTELREYDRHALGLLARERDVVLGTHSPRRRSMRAVLKPSGQREGRVKREPDQRRLVTDLSMWEPDDHSNGDVRGWSELEQGHPTTCSPTVSDDGRLDWASVVGSLDKG